MTATVLKQQVAAPTRPRRSVLIAAICLVLIALGLVVWVASRPSAPPAGPLVAWRTGFQHTESDAVGSPLSWGLIWLKNPTDETVHLDGINVKSNDSRFTGGVLVTQWHTTPSGKLVYPNLSSEGGTVPGWPPPDALPGDLVPPGKAIIQPHRSVDVEVELVPPDKGRYVAGPAVVDYHIDGDHYRVVSRNYTAICAPRVPDSQAAKDCPIGHLPY